jgi:chemotaxis protein MotB
MRRLPDEQVYQVGGHTDSRPITTRKLVERYPTNWELSTSRATNVARFLEEEGHIPGKQLVAAGFAQYRPTSNNRTRRGRRQNRRIEIVLLDR